jgi:hypothetical protein
MNNEIKKETVIAITVTNTNEYENRKFQLFGSNKYIFSDGFLKDGALLSIDGVRIQSYNEDMSYRDMLLGLLTNTVQVRCTLIESRNEKYRDLEAALNIKNPVLLRTKNPVFGRGAYTSSCIEFIKNPFQTQYSFVESREEYIVDGFTTLYFPELAPKAELKILLNAIY